MEPVVCTLTTKELAARKVEWADVQAQSLSSVAIDKGAAMTVPGSLAADIAALAAAECQCCTFLTITTERLDGLIRIEITSENPDGRPIAEALAGLRRLP